MSQSEVTRTNISVGTSWLSGSVSGLASSILLQPLDVARTEIQRRVHGDKISTRQAISAVSSRSHDAESMFTHLNGLISCFVRPQIVDKHGATALWRGLAPTIARVGFGTGMYFSLLNHMTAMWSRPGVRLLKCRLCVRTKFSSEPAIVCTNTVEGCAPIVAPCVSSCFSFMRAKGLLLIASHASSSSCMKSGK
jgi:hypothetical protein